MDLYEPTLKALIALDSHITKGGYIVFDQGLKKNWGEGLAIKNFFKLNNKKYKIIKIDNVYQSDIILKKL